MLGIVKKVGIECISHRSSFSFFFFSLNLPIDKGVMESIIFPLFSVIGGLP